MMKKFFLIVFIASLLLSCSKFRKCWILSDCIGNDIGSYCGTENQVQEHCRDNESPGCTWSYRPE